MNTVTDKPCAISDAGSRLQNEDALYPQPETLSQRHRLFLVCDGVGGSAKGEVASALACESIQSYFSTFLEGDPTPAFVRKAVCYAESCFDNYIAAHPEAHGMATTLTLLYVGNGYALVAHAGDSRIYQFREGSIRYRTEDHSLVNSWVRLGRISREEMYSHPKRNVILKAIEGSSRPVDVEVQVLYDVKEGDDFFLCTDGVLEAVTEETLTGLFDGSRSADDIKDHLVEACSLRSRDNYSFYIVPVCNLHNSAAGLRQNLLSFFYSFV
ncbi:MAG: protein phosphatase 2C domain-containing protein [Tannerellaceae bacterium]|jgi:protein phosphatase|nr:protein phosphatase 2C domain-containing protein [Tannerellaceae bacterium]